MVSARKVSQEDGSI